MYDLSVSQLIDEVHTIQHSQHALLNLIRRDKAPWFNISSNLNYATVLNQSNQGRYNLIQTTKKIPNRYR